MSNPYTELAEESKKSGNHYVRYIYEQKQEAYQEGLATAQEKVERLQKWIDDVDKAHRKEIKAIKKEIAELAKFCIEQTVREGNNNVET